MNDKNVEERNFSSFADPTWFQGNDGSSVRLRFFRIGKVPHQFIGRYLTNFPTSYFVEQPVNVSVVVVKDFDFSDLHMQPMSDSDGMSIFKADVRQRVVFGGAMLVLSTPEKLDGVRVDPGLISKSLDIVRALLSLQLGSCFFFDEVLETTIDMQTGSHSIASEAVKVSHTGPYLSANRWSSLRVLSEKLSTGELKGRIEFALERLAIALKRGGDFLDYWIALEVLCNGTAAAVRARLARAYGLSRPHDVDDEFGFDLVAAARHGLVHRGERVAFSPAFEEYMNAMFLDILCYETGIPEVGHLRRIVGRENQDLTFLNRAPRQADSDSASNGGEPHSNKRDIAKEVEEEKERVLKEWERQLRSAGL